MANATEAGPGKAAALLTDQLKEFAGSWAKYSALGSFALYVAGYLALRFHVTALGVGTDLAVLDERYVFTGARFLIFVCSVLPSLVLLGLPLLVIRWWLARGLKLQAPQPDAPTNWPTNWPATAEPSRSERLYVWCAHPTRLALTGIVIAVVLIQLVMRQCFLLSHLLLAECLPSHWLYDLLRHPLNASLYFTALVAGVVVTAALWYGARHAVTQTAWSRVWTRLLAVLVAIQFLLLPVNYGVLIVDKTLPQVADLGGSEPLPSGQEAWLVWEGKDGVTWLVRAGESRKLVTLPQKEVKKTQIIRYDALANVLTNKACDVPQ